MRLDLERPVARAVTLRGESINEGPEGIAQSFGKQLAFENVAKSALDSGAGRCWSSRRHSQPRVAATRGRVVAPEVLIEQPGRASLGCSAEGGSPQATRSPIRPMHFGLSNDQATEGQDLAECRTTASTSNAH